jgi:hypothetical protein
MHRLSWLVPVMLLVACEPLPTEPAALDGAPDLATTSNDRESVAFEAQACNGELVEVNGEVHHLVTTTSTPSGNLHITDHIVVRATGIGATTGATYQLREVGTVSHTVSGPLPESFTFIDTGGLIGQGSSADFHFKIHFHFTINANGEVTADIGDVNILCR